MIYRVCEHYYNDDLPIIQNIPEECFVCLEMDDCNGLKSINLKTQHIYIKNCTCNGWIHRSCLETWCKKNAACPICRMQISVNIPVNYSLIVTFRIHVIYFSVIQIFKKLIKFVVMISFFYTSCQIYFSLFFITFINKNIDNNYSFNSYSGFDFNNQLLLKNTTEEY